MNFSSQLLVVSRGEGGEQGSRTEKASLIRILVRKQAELRDRSGYILNDRRIVINLDFFV
jgi:hypothetical protein